MGLSISLYYVLRKSISALVLDKICNMNKYKNIHILFLDKNNTQDSFKVIHRPF